MIEYKLSLFILWWWWWWGRGAEVKFITRFEMKNKGESNQGPLLARPPTLRSAWMHPPFVGHPWLCTSGSEGPPYWGPHWGERIGFFTSKWLSPPQSLRLSPLRDTALGQVGPDGELPLKWLLCRRLWGWAGRTLPSAA